VKTSREHLLPISAITVELRSRASAQIKSTDYIFSNSAECRRHIQRLVKSKSALNTEVELEREWSVSNAEVGAISPDYRAVGRATAAAGITVFVMVVP
jgi:hypothetical protein